MEAHQAYLKGRYFWNKRTEEGLKKAIGYFEQAIRIDRNYAPAYAGLADSYALLNFYGALQLKEVLPKARAAAEKALEIDNTLAEAHTTLAYVKYYHDWNWSGAEREYQRAIELNPNYATAHQWYAEYLMYMERFDESLAEFKRAQELDPLSLVINTELGSPYLYMRQCDQAMKQYQKGLEMDPNFPLAVYCMGLCYEQQGMYEEAIAAYRKSKTMFGNNWGLGALGTAYAASGRKREAREALKELIEASRQRPVSLYPIVRIETALGEKDQAFAWLEKAYKDRDERLLLLKADPYLDALRSDLRFKELLRRMNLAE